MKKFHYIIIFLCLSVIQWSCLNEQDIPSAVPVTMLSIDAVSASSVSYTYRITSVGLSPVTEAGVMIDGVKHPTGGSRFSCNEDYTGIVTGLSSNTRYTIVPYAVNADGTGWAREQVFTTDKSAISVDKKLITFPYTLSTATVNVTANVNWALTIDYSSTPSDWLTVLPRTGEGSKNIALAASGNPTGTSRSATVTLTTTDGGSPATFTVTQEPKPELKLSADTCVFPCTASSQMVTLTSNVAWKATCSDTWLHVTPLSGTSESSVCVSADVNPQTEQRQATVNFASLSGDLLATCMVTQLGVPEFKLDVNHIDFPYTASEQTVTLTSTTAWTASTSVDRFVVTPSSGTGNAKVTISASANEVVATCTATITFTASDGQPPAVLKVVQAACPGYLSLTTDESLVDIGQMVSDLEQRSKCITQKASELETQATEAAYRLDQIQIGAEAERQEKEEYESLCASLRAQAESLRQTAQHISEAKAQAKQAWEQQASTAKAVKLGHAAQSIQVDISSNTSWTTTSSASWLSIDNGSGSKTKSLKITAAANKDSAPRVAIVTVQGNSVEDAEQLIVVQGGMPTLLEHNMTLAYATHYVAFLTDGDWQTTAPDWLVISPDKGVGDVVVAVSADKRITTSTQQTAMVVFTSGSTTETLSVTKGVQAENTQKDGHAYVDLGLPSGILWATMNVGATSPEDYGDYFAWGETKPQADNSYSWSSYKWCGGSVATLTKYCTDSNYGTVDNKTFLESEDDAAHANWGGGWRMPTCDELDELRTQCDWTWTQVNGVSGYKVQSKQSGNTHSIFFPAAGRRNNSGIYAVGLYGYYWSSTLGKGIMDYVYLLSFYSRDVSSDDYGRFNGLSVRPVWTDAETVSNVTVSPLRLTLEVGDATILKATVSPSTAADKTIIWESSNAKVVMVSSSGEVVALSSGTATITATASNGKKGTCDLTVKNPNEYNGHEYVDLGLPSGLKWATCNVGAPNPENYGDYFAWGETEPQANTIYTWSSYKWCNGSPSALTKYCTDSQYGAVDKKNVLEPKDDVAHVKWGGNWRIPTIEELTELCTECTWTWTQVNGVNGYKISSKQQGNTHSIFLPAAGCLNYGVNLVDSHGYYWSSSLHMSDSRYAFGSFFYSKHVGSYNYGDRYYGRSVRPVFAE